MTWSVIGIPLAAQWKLYDDWLHYHVLRESLLVPFRVRTMIFKYPTKHERPLWVSSRLFGIDKLTCKRGLALPNRGLNAQYIDASAHRKVIFKSKRARKSHIPATEIVNLSIPNQSIASSAQAFMMTGEDAEIDKIRSAIHPGIRKKVVDATRKHTNKAASEYDNEIKNAKAVKRRQCGIAGKGSGRNAENHQ